MRKIGFLLLLVACNPEYRTFQVNYQEDNESKYIYLNVKQINKDHFKVISQEHSEDNTPNFIITEIFDYGRY